MTKPELTAVEIRFLAAFSHPREDYNEGWLDGHLWNEWQDALGAAPSEFVRRAFNRGLLIQCGLAVRLDYWFKAADIKARLKASGLKTSGKKHELIARWVEGDPAAARSAVPGRDLYMLSEAGSKAVS